MIDRAIGLLEDWIQSHPDAALPRIAVADFYTAAGKSEPAIRHLEKALQKHPENTLVLNNLAWLLQDRSDKALAPRGGRRPWRPTRPMCWIPWR